MNLGPSDGKFYACADNLIQFIICVIVAQSCPTLCNAMDGSLPGSSVHGILQVRMLEWVAIPFSRTMAVQSTSVYKASAMLGAYVIVVFFLY